MTKLARSTWLTVGGVTGAVAAFLFGVWLPGARRLTEIEQRTAAARQEVQSVPARVAGFELLRSQVAAAEEYVASCSRRLPARDDVHAVVSRISQLARDCRLTVTRLEPQEPEVRETYAARAFRIAFAGSFTQVFAFVSDLEADERFYAVREIELSCEPGKDRQPVQADVQFVVYTARSESAESAEKSASSASGTADFRSQ
ncbi:MAG: type 4a pilus biogenesis protein PilO [Planctomycetes bacterium]|nr:type 4a pilus biogenesis protein PilO [Planctomycetota bacterium]